VNDVGVIYANFVDTKQKKIFLSTTKDLSALISKIAKIFILPNIYAIY
jgi:hypothetical protein